MQMSITEPCLLKYIVLGVPMYTAHFLLALLFKDTSGKVILQKNGRPCIIPSHYIKNDYIAKVVPGKHSLIIPLGNKLL